MEYLKHWWEPALCSSSEVAAETKNNAAEPGFLGCCLGARSHRPCTPPPLPRRGRAGRWTDDDAGLGRLADTGVPVAASGTKPTRQRRGQHLSLLARLPLFSAEAAAAANCHGHQVTGARRQPLPAGPKDGRGRSREGLDAGRRWG